MAPGGLEEQTSNQDVLQGILATLKRVEQLLSHQNQPYPSNLCEGNRENFAGNKIGNGAGEDDGGLQSSSEKGDGNGIEDGDQDKNGARNANQGGDEEEDGDKVDNNDAGGEYQRIQDGAEAVNRQEGQSIKTNIADIPEFGEVIGFGERIPHSSVFSLRFSQSFLELFGPDEVKQRIEAISAYSTAASVLGDLVQLKIIDLPISDLNMDMYESPIRIFIRNENIHEGKKCPVHYFRGRIIPTPDRPMSYGRILLFQGYSEMAIKVKSADPHKVCPLIFSGAGEILPPEVNRWSRHNFIINDAAYSHYACEERPRGLHRGFIGNARYIFHTTFYEIQKSPAKPGSWASGRLYSFDNRKCKSFRKACITIATSRYKTGPISPAEWAITVLAPSGFPKPYETLYGGPLGLKFPALDSESYRDAVLQVITTCVHHIIYHWQILYDEILKECNGENVSFMDSEQYIHLLYDDSTFWRSKFYFWAIGCLSSFEQSVAGTLWELTTFRLEVDNKSPLGKRAASGSNEFKEVYNEEMENFDQACKTLEGIHDQLVKTRDEMKTLRDGLFSASSVMETRQSRILGENVQLLAFVTIFFLPLAFSASLWSIPGVNERFPGLTIPGAVAAIIAFLTYFIVFNLNLLISGIRRLFSVPRSVILTRDGE